VITLISLKGFARRRKLGYTTIRGYYRDNRLPEPDGWLTDDPGGDSKITKDDVYRRPGWLPDSIDNWQRPGQGARTDLKPDTGNRSE
jgi:hypothetical protein